MCGDFGSYCRHNGCGASGFYRMQGLSICLCIFQVDIWSFIGNANLYDTPLENSVCLPSSSTSKLLGGMPVWLHMGRDAYHPFETVLFLRSVSAVQSMDSLRSATSSYSPEIVLYGGTLPSYIIVGPEIV